MHGCRFKLLDAAPEYADIHTLLLRKLDLCSAAVHSLRSHEGVHPADAAAHAVASQSDSLAEAAELADDAAFIESQLHAWLKVRQFCLTLCILLLLREALGTNFKTQLHHLCHVSQSYV